MRRTRLGSEGGEPPSPLEAVREAQRNLELAKEARDRAIVTARLESLSLSDVAEAAGLSVPRVKQIAASRRGRLSGASRPPITEVDILVAGSLADRGDRVFALEQVAPSLRRWRSEREFIQEDVSRRVLRMDVGNDIFDDDPDGPKWTVCWVPGTCEVYAFQRGGGYTGEDAGFGPKGSLSGPCVRLGHLPSEEVVMRALADQMGAASHRLGSLAWVYGRIRLMNRLLWTFSMALEEVDQRTRNYFEGLPPDEQPGR